MAETNPTPNPNETQPTPQGNNQQTPSFDYDKLASLITGKQSVTEDTVLKSYFKEQGLSADEMKQAIGAFKEQKAKNTPDIAKMQSEVESANNAKLTAEVNQSATLEAVKQGVDIATVPYVLKMADFSAVITDGKINTEKLTEAVKKVLDDIPALKKTADNSVGVQKIGGDGNGTSDGTKPNSSVPTKKWNRFNI
ncbi:hypothetical protein LCN94_04770 [Ruminococcus sp. FMB-CY1]|uniref:hypothetical protein n=1 Tax=unclassified Ruminococcus TaxID=2608920 RepID=UPI00208E4A9B|nr:MULTISPECIES: hypothetical protein [unclassified Ruminococcus]USP70407.1 hypothetical protein KGF34_03525 [Ruminococcus sp. FMBCY1]WBX58426.1 hypothetical protein LCN94_04770 [Ruminococcus sp. FMB-CY1]